MDLRPFQYLLTPLRHLGIADSTIEGYTALTGKFEHLDQIDEEISKYEIPDEERKGDVFLPLVHSHGRTFFIVAALAHAFRCRGYRPIIGVCDSFLPLCLRKYKNPDTSGSCVNCHHETKTHLDAFGFEPAYFESYLPEDYVMPTPEEASPGSYEYRGVDVSNYALATTRRFLRKYTVDFTDADDRSVYNRFLAAGIGLVDATHAIIDEHDIATTIGFHAPYVYGGTIMATSREREIPTFNQEGGFLREGTLMFGNMAVGDGIALYSAEGVLENKLSKPLSETDEEMADEYMLGWRTGANARDIHQYTESATRSLDINTDNPTVGLFSNLLWDSSLIGTDLLFEDPFEWVNETIEFCAAEGVTLVVKPHPAESHVGTNEPIEAAIRDHFDSLPDNVVLLSADTDVDPYRLANQLDAGIVYNSTLGLEMAYDSIPVIVAGETHYRDCGFTFDPDTRDEYFSILGNCDELTVTPDMKDRAKRYAYHLLAERHIQFDFVDLEAKPMPPLSHKRLKKGNEKLDEVIDQILTGEPTISYTEAR